MCESEKWKGSCSVVIISNKYLYYLFLYNEWLIFFFNKSFESESKVETFGKTGSDTSDCVHWPWPHGHFNSTVVMGRRGGRGRKKATLTRSTPVKGDTLLLSLILDFPQLEIRSHLSLGLNPPIALRILFCHGSQAKWPSSPAPFQTNSHSQPWLWGGLLNFVLFMIIPSYFFL